MQFAHVMHKRLMRYNNGKQNFKGRYNFREIQLQGMFCSFFFLSQALTKSLHMYAGDSVTPYINDIPIEEIVVDDAFQSIAGNKAILKNVYIRGSLSVDNINGHIIENLYQKTIFLNKNATVMTNMVRNVIASIEFVVMKHKLYYRMSVKLTFQET